MYLVIGNNINRQIAKLYRYRIGMDFNSSAQWGVQKLHIEVFKKYTMKWGMQKVPPSLCRNMKTAD